MSGLVAAFVLGVLLCLAAQFCWKYRGNIAVLFGRKFPPGDSAAPPPPTDRQA